MLMVCSLQAKAALAQSTTGEDNQAPSSYGSPQKDGCNEQHKGLSSSIDAHVEGQSAVVNMQAERQSPGTEGQAERQTQGGSGREGSELDAAMGVWQAFRDLLPVQRYWWMKQHFR